VPLRAISQFVQPSRCRNKNSTPNARDRHTLLFEWRYSGAVMRGAFVLQFGQAFQSGRRLEGCIEEVDTGKQFRFRSAKAMVHFIEHCLTASAETLNQDNAQSRETMNVATTHPKGKDQ
jgi:hypothetical protein